MNENKNNKTGLIVFILIILFFVYLFTLPKSHWLIGVWNWFMVGRY